MIDTHLGHVAINPRRGLADRLPADLKQRCSTPPPRSSPRTTSGCRAAREDTNTWKERGGKIVTLSPAEQQEAERRVTAAIQPVLDKSAPLKEFYNKVKAGAATVQ